MKTIYEIADDYAANREARIAEAKRKAIKEAIDRHRKKVTAQFKEVFAEFLPMLDAEGIMCLVEVGQDNPQQNTAIHFKVPEIEEVFELQWAMECSEGGPGYRWRLDQLFAPNDPDMFIHDLVQWIRDKKSAFLQA